MRRLKVLILASLLGPASCGGDSGPTAPAVPTPPTQPPPPPPPPTVDLSRVQAAITDPFLVSLVSALTPGKRDAVATVLNACVQASAVDDAVLLRTCLTAARTELATASAAEDSPLLQVADLMLTHAEQVLAQLTS